MLCLRWGRVRSAVALCALGASAHTVLNAQNCTTQSRMTAQQRTGIGSAAYALASAVLAGDPARVRANTIAKFAADQQTVAVVTSTSGRIAGDTLVVTQAYLLDASGRSASDTSEADFACPLLGTVSETDFGIPGLPAGKFAFVMVEARGTHPWLLSFLLEQEGGAWKMAGFYPHERDAAGHDGVWYWTTARADAKSNKPWLAWVMFEEADALLRPATFVSSANLDKLRTEQRAAAPESLSNGLSAQAPLSLVGTNGAPFRVTRLEAQGGENGTELNLVMHIQTDPGTTREDAVNHSLAAANALLNAHPELRQGFENIWVIAEMPGINPVVTQKPMREIATVNR